MSKREMTPERREYQRNYQRGWAKRRRAAWLAANGPCRQCSSWERLEVDHIDPALKVTHQVWSWTQEKREAELKKCQPLCHECHQAKTSQYNSERYKGQPGTPKKLTEKQVLDIYGMQGLTVREIGRFYGINHSTVCGIKSGRLWSWLTKHELSASSARNWVAP